MIYSNYLFPKILELIKYTKKLDYQVIHLVSNGRRYADRLFLKKIIEAGANRFSVSIHSHQPKIEDYLTSVKGSFDQKIKGLHNLIYFKKIGLIKNEIALNIVINRLNYRHLPQILDFYRKIGVKEFRLNFIRAEGRAFENFKEIVPRYQWIMPYLKKAIKLGEKWSIRITIEGIPFCLIYKVKNFEKYVGELYDKHINVVFYNILPSGFQKDGDKNLGFRWEQKRTELKKKDIKCKKCYFNAVCEGVWRNYADKIGWQEFKPVKIL